MPAILVPLRIGLNVRFSLGPHWGRTVGHTRLNHLNATSFCDFARVSRCLTWHGPRAHEHQRCTTVLEYAVGDAAKRQPLQTCPPVRRHHHQRGMRLFRRADNGSCSVARFNAITDRNTRLRPQACHQRLEVVSNRADAVVHLCSNGGGDFFVGAQNVVGSWIDAYQDDFPAQIISESQRGWEYGFRKSQPSTGTSSFGWSARRINRRPGSHARCRRIGTGLHVTSASATLPSIHLLGPVRPCVDMTIRSAGYSRAATLIILATGSPLSSAVSTRKSRSRRSAAVFSR